MPSSAEEFKDVGNGFFKAGKYKEAIAQYTKAIKIDNNHHVYYYDRSAAHLKNGEPNLALRDAEECLAIQPDFAKGYSCKGAALHLLRRYNDAIATLEEGLERCPGDDMLQRELNEVKSHKPLNINKSRRLLRKSSLEHQKKSAGAGTMTEFVKFAKSNLALQISNLESQLKMIEALADMTDEEKFSFVFRLLDVNKDGHISARELSNALTMRNKELPFAGGLQKAVDFVALYDENKDKKLSPDEFKVFLDTTLEELEGTSLTDLCEFLVLQVVFNDGEKVEDEKLILEADSIDEAIELKAEFYDLVTDERMMGLFLLFDSNGNGYVDFKEVALGLYKITNDMGESTQQAVELLLMLKKDDGRELNYEQFGRLILHVTALGGKTFDDVADELSESMCRQVNVSDEAMGALMVADEVYQSASTAADMDKEENDLDDILKYAKTQRLFDLWDLNQDKTIDYDELLSGLHKYQEAMGIDDSVQEAAIAEIGFAKGTNKELSRQEFGAALLKYATALDAELHDVVDFMCVASTCKDNDKVEAAYIKAISTQASAEVRRLQNEGIIVVDVE